MSFPYFIAHRIHFSKGEDSQRVSPPAIRIAIAGIAIGVMVMILAVAIVIGFKKEIREKVTSFGGHLQVHAMSYNTTYETAPICISVCTSADSTDSGNPLLYYINNVTAIESAAPYITKPAVLKTEEDFLAVVVKGEGIEGRRTIFSDSEAKGDLGEREILISQTIADKMHLGEGDKVRLYFIKADQNANQFAFGAEDSSIKTRQVTVAGIYDSGLHEYDRQMIFCNMEMLQKVNGWDEDMVSGVEVNLMDFAQLDEKYIEMIDAVHGINDRRGTAFHVQSIKQLNPQIFSWLDLLDTNVWVILILMTVVAAFTMISGLLIIILERSRTIVMLKTLGCNNSQLRHVFLYVSAFLIGKGLVIGNIIGIAFCFIQQKFHIITLDPQYYYLDYVPVNINIYGILAINLGTIIITLLTMIVPASLVAKISANYLR